MTDKPNEEVIIKAKNIRYRGGVQPISEYKKIVAKNQSVADREYDGQYRGVEYHHDKGADAIKHEESQHEVEVQYRGANGVALID